jgi:alpha-mannosidase
VDQKNVVLETVKQAEDGSCIILRLYEAENAATKATISVSSDYTIEEVSECNLIEEHIETIAQDKNSFKVFIKPYEIKTYKLRFK